MATERQSPDAILAITNLTPNNVSYIQDDPDSPDGNWLVATGNNSNIDVRVGLPTPTGNPIVGADLQEFKAWVKQYDEGQGGTPDVRIELWEDGNLIRAGSDEAVPQGGKLISFTWNANELGTADGSLVEIKVVGTKSGGSPSNRNTVNVGAVEWNVDYAAGGVDVTIDAPLAIGDSEAKVPTPGLGVTLSPPIAISNGQGVTPSLSLDRIINSPLAVVDGQAMVPSLSLDSMLQSSAIVASSQALTPDLSLGKTLNPPSIDANGEALIPVISTGEVSEAYGYII